MSWHYWYSTKTCRLVEKLSLSGSPRSHSCHTFLRCRSRARDKPRCNLESSDLSYMDSGWHSSGGVPIWWDLPLGCWCPDTLGLTTIMYFTGLIFYPSFPWYAPWRCALAWKIQSQENWENVWRNIMFFATLNRSAFRDALSTDFHAWPPYLFLSLFRI